MAKAPAALKTQDADEDISPVAKVARDMPKQLASHDIQPEGAKWGRWAVMAHADHDISDCLGPRYLYGKADQLQPGDYVEIKHPFGFFVVCLDVVRVDTQARGVVAHIRHVFDYRKAETMVAPDLSGARVELLGGREWSVIDGHHVVKDLFPTKTAAEAWLSDQRRGR